MVKKSTPSCPPAVESTYGNNDPAAILAAWTALEVLSPQIYKKPEELIGGKADCVERIDGGHLPWSGGNFRPNDPHLFYLLILGSIPMAPAAELLAKAFGHDDEGRPASGSAALAVVLLDSSGVLLDKDAIVVSSFGWALPLALASQLEGLDAWLTVEPKVITLLTEVLTQVEEKDKDKKRPIPIDHAVIAEAYDRLVSHFRLPTNFVEAPTVVLRIDQHLSAKNPPALPLLNSFFLTDLARARELALRHLLPSGIGRYLAVTKPSNSVDLLADQKALRRVIAPEMMPRARWPSAPNQPLVLLQQAAVNTVNSAQDPIVAVNGPPGTGKTTLLRDIVAARVLDRALAMVAFVDPARAFTQVSAKVSVGNVSFHPYLLTDTIKGHEMVVASSNNKAVENVSLELPSIKAIDPSVGLRYFKSVSDLLMRRRAPHAARNGQAPCQAEAHETWGLMAAVLGNSGNIFNFREAFWWDNNDSFRLYLKAVKNAQAGQPHQHIPHIVEIEQPPSPQQARANWGTARVRFLSLKQNLDRELECLEQVHRLCVRHTEARQALIRAECDLTQVMQQLDGIVSTVNEQRARSARSARDLQDVQRALVDHQRLKPWLWCWLFQTEHWRCWRSIRFDLMVNSRDAQAVAERDISSQRIMEETQTSLRAMARAADERAVILRRQVAAMTAEIDTHRTALGGALVDDDFFNRSHADLHLASPWLTDHIHRQRAELFIAALAVHRAFIDASAQPLSNNLAILMDMLAGRPLTVGEHEGLLASLWSTLFLVVPVVSTTFASVGRMFGPLPPESIGWLLIDEAGQALPQAAVGMIMRAKRTIVVGDPLQIPPVASIPVRLTKEVCNFFRVDTVDWAAPDASVQTVADRASRYQASFRADPVSRRVGIPLLVHRRCQEPMFGISNRMAYDGQMVHAPLKSGTGAIGGVLGPSTWFDIVGKASSKWCLAEGRVVIDLLTKLSEANVFKPDLYIITPFREVSQEMKALLRRHTMLLQKLGLSDEWMKERVGTVHTVQGREADSVILILGAPSATDHRARVWAAGTPNILNVAVTRAKQHLYVVGSYEAWAGIGHAKEFEILPRSHFDKVPSAE